MIEHCPRSAIAGSNARSRLDRWADVGMRESIGTEVAPWSMGDRQPLPFMILSPALRGTGGYPFLPAGKATFRNRPSSPCPTSRPHAIIHPGSFQPSVSTPRAVRTGTRINFAKYLLLRNSRHHSASTQMRSPRRCELRTFYKRACQPRSPLARNAATTSALKPSPASTVAPSSPSRAT